MNAQFERGANHCGAQLPPSSHGNVLICGASDSDQTNQFAMPCHNVFVLCWLSPAHYRSRTDFADFQPLNC